MTTRRFNVAGWLALLSAIVMVPVLAVAVAVGIAPENAQLQAVNDVLAVGSAALGIYLLIALRRLLHTHDFHAADFLFALLIWGLVVGVVLEVGGGVVAESYIVAGILFVYSLLLGLVSGVLGIKILPAARVVPGPMKPFAYLTIASGFCVAAVILIPVGLLASVVADILLALIFFRASEAPVTAEIAL